jgi:hypothetical protein
MMSTEERSEVCAPPRPRVDSKRELVMEEVWEVVERDVPGSSTGLTLRRVRMVLLPTVTFTNRCNVKACWG